VSFLFLPSFLPSPLLPASQARESRVEKERRNENELTTGSSSISSSSSPLPLSSSSFFSTSTSFFFLPLDPEPEAAGFLSSFLEAALTFSFAELVEVGFDFVVVAVEPEV